MTFALWAIMLAGTLPSWLDLHPGMKPAVVDSPGMVEVSYLFAGKPAEAVEHYKEVFAKAKLAFGPNADGIGMAARVAAPECDLMLQFHPAPSGTTVRIYCASKTPPAQASTFYVPPAGTGRYQAQRVSATSSTNPHVPKNDAPPLQWPAWLQLIGTNQALRTEKVYIESMPCLRAGYTVAPSQRKPLIMAYRDLMQSNGFRIDRVTFSTGNTITGAVVEDFRGYVEGIRSPDGSYGSASTILKVSFSRGGSLSDPGRMSVCVCVRGSTN
jgi:hypothetical protein